MMRCLTFALLAVAALRVHAYEFPQKDRVLARETASVPGH